MTTSRELPSRTLLSKLASAIVMQALLSGSNLAIGLIMIRRTTDLQYGYYVLMLNTLLLMVTLQGSFIQPQLVVRMSTADEAGRADLIGGLYREQRTVRSLLLVFLLLAVGVLRLTGAIGTAGALVTAAGSIAVFFALHREFIRMALLNHRRPGDVLAGDVAYVLLMVGGVLLATLTPAPAACAALAMAGAAILGAAVCSRRLWRFEPWNVRGAPGILKAITPLGIWAAGGAGVHWLFSQGYNYVIAGLLSIQAVGAIAATRLTIMPVNLLSTGIGTMMLPTTAQWLHAHGAAKVLRRMVLVVLAMSAAAACYFALIWSVREWLFTVVLKKSFAHRDELLLLWFCTGWLMLVRDQLIYLVTIRQRFRAMSTLTLASAGISLTVSYLCTLRLGIIGALLGIIVGELANLSGLIVLSILETRRPTPMPSAPVPACSVE